MLLTVYGILWTWLDGKLLFSKCDTHFVLKNPALQNSSTLCLGRKTVNWLFTSEAAEIVLDVKICWINDNHKVRVKGAVRTYIAIDWGLKWLTVWWGNPCKHDAHPVPFKRNSSMLSKGKPNMQSTCWCWWKSHWTVMSCSLRAGSHGSFLCSKLLFITFFFLPITNCDFPSIAMFNYQGTLFDEIAMICRSKNNMPWWSHPFLLLHAWAMLV